MPVAGVELPAPQISHQRKEVIPMAAAKAKKGSKKGKGKDKC